MHHPPPGGHAEPAARHRQDRLHSVWRLCGHHCHTPGTSERSILGRYLAVLVRFERTLAHSMTPASALLGWTAVCFTRSQAWRDACAGEDAVGARMVLVAWDSGAAVCTGGRCRQALHVADTRQAPSRGAQLLLEDAVLPTRSLCAERGGKSEYPSTVLSCSLGRLALHLRGPDSCTCASSGRPSGRLLTGLYLCAGARTELVHTGDTAAAIVAVMNLIFA